MNIMATKDGAIHAVDLIGAPLAKDTIDKIERAKSGEDRHSHADGESAKENHHEHSGKMHHPD